MITLLGVRYNFVILQLLYSAVFTTAVGVSYAYPHLIEKKSDAQVISLPEGQNRLSEPYFLVVRLVLSLPCWAFTSKVFFCFFFQMMCT